MPLRPHSGFLFLSLAWVVSSCGGNDLHYEAATHTLTTCSGATLTSVFITGRGVTDFYHLQKRPGAAGTASLRLDQLGESYLVRGWDDRLRPTGVQLRPNSSYRIRNVSNGDAASADVVVRTGADGLLSEGSPTTCR